MYNLYVEIVFIRVDAIDVAQADRDTRALEPAQSSIDAAFVRKVWDEGANGAFANESITMRGKGQFEESASGALNVEWRAIVIHVTIELIAKQDAQSWRVDGVAKSQSRRMESTVRAQGVETVTL